MLNFTGISILIYKWQLRQWFSA